MRILNFCAGCGILLSEQELKEYKRCPNCDNGLTNHTIPGQFTDEDASRLETAVTDQTQ